MKISSINIKKVLIIASVASVSILLVFFSIPFNPSQSVEACGAYSGGGHGDQGGGHGDQGGGHGDQGGGHGDQGGGHGGH